jgi:hypothetical protein
MMEDERLGVLGTPIFVEDLNAILGGNIAHGFDPFGWQIAVPGARARANADPKEISMTPKRTRGLAGSDDGFQMLETIAVAKRWILASLLASTGAYRVVTGPHGHVLHYND